MSNKIPCGGFNLDESLVVDKKTRLGTVIGGGLSPFVPFNKFLNMTFGEDGTIFSVPITEQVTSIGSLIDGNAKAVVDLSEQNYDPRKMLLGSIVEYEIEYCGLKTTEYNFGLVRVGKGSYRAAYSLGLPAKKFGDFYTEGILPDQYDFPFALIQMGDSLDFIVLDEKLLKGNSVLTLRKRIRYINQIGNSFSNTQKILFYYDASTTKLDSNLGLKPLSAQFYLYGSLGLFGGVKSVNQIPECYLMVTEEDEDSILTCTQRVYKGSSILFKFYEYDNMGAVNKIYNVVLNNEGISISVNNAGGGPVR